MAEKDKAFDVSKIGDTVIRDRDSDEKPEFLPQDSTASQQDHAQFKDKETIESGHGTITSYWDMHSNSFDVSKMGDTVIRERDSDSGESMILGEDSTEEPASEEEHPFKFQEPPQIKRVHSFTSYWQKKDKSFDVSKIGDTVIRGRARDAKAETSKKKPSSEE